MKLLLWSFIVVVALLDLVFAWQHQGTLGEWEANPVASLLFAQGGVPALAIYRLGWVGFACLMDQTKTRFTPLVLPVWTIAHVRLLVILLVAAWAIKPR